MYKSKRIVMLFVGVLFTVFYCEYLIYYIVAVQCSWPSIESSNNESSQLKAFIFADPHLMGPRKSHWLDKWRREWQMHRAYMAILSIHKPNVIFILGDLFDEGELSNSKQFQVYVNRFHDLFPVPDDANVAMHVVAGNHDMGFHNIITRDRAQRFEKMLNNSVVDFISVNNNHFVLINSMAMEGDRCSMCTEARKEINKIEEILKCAEDSLFCEDGIKRINYSRPIVLQHFPLYRLSDAECTGPDAAPLPQRYKHLHRKHTSLSKEATNFLANKLKPRLDLGGHTHHGCMVLHNYSDPEPFSFYEYSVPSFSWRNRPNPKYMLVSITPSDYAVRTCSLPQEATIVICAVLMMFAVIQKMKRRTL